VCVDVDAGGIGVDVQVAVFVLGTLVFVLGTVVLVEVAAVGVSVAAASTVAVDVSAPAGVAVSVPAGTGVSEPSLGVTMDVAVSVGGDASGVTSPTPATGVGSASRPAGALPGNASRMRCRSRKTHRSMRLVGSSDHARDKSAAWP
jgi:hypothetical protein